VARSANSCAGWLLLKALQILLQRCKSLLRTGPIKKKGPQAPVAPTLLYLPNLLLRQHCILGSLGDPELENGTDSTRYILQSGDISF